MWLADPAAQSNFRTTPMATRGAPTSTTFIDRRWMQAQSCWRKPRPYIATTVNTQRVDLCREREDLSPVANWAALVAAHPPIAVSTWRHSVHPVADGTLGSLTSFRTSFRGNGFTWMSLPELPRRRSSSERHVGYRQRVAHVSARRRCASSPVGLCPAPATCQACAPRASLALPIVAVGPSARADLQTEQFSVASRRAVASSDCVP